MGRAGLWVDNAGSMRGVGDSQAVGGGEVVRQEDGFSPL